MQTTKKRTELTPNGVHAAMTALVGLYAFAVQGWMRERGFYDLLNTFWTETIGLSISIGIWLTLIVYLVLAAGLVFIGLRLLRLVDVHVPILQLLTGLLLLQIVFLFQGTVALDRMNDQRHYLEDNSSSYVQDAGQDNWQEGFVRIDGELATGKVFRAHFGMQTRRGFLAFSSNYYLVPIVGKDWQQGDEITYLYASSAPIVLDAASTTYIELIYGETWRGVAQLHGVISPEGLQIGAKIRELLANEGLHLSDQAVIISSGDVPGSKQLRYMLTHLALMLSISCIAIDQAFRVWAKRNQAGSSGIVIWVLVGLCLATFLLLASPLYNLRGAQHEKVVVGEESLPAHGFSLTGTYHLDQTIYRYHVSNGEEDEHLFYIPVSGKNSKSVSAVVVQSRRISLMAPTLVTYYSTDRDQLPELDAVEATTQGRVWRANAPVPDWIKEDLLSRGLEVSPDADLFVDQNEGVGVAVRVMKHLAWLFLLVTGLSVALAFIRRKTKK